MKAASPPNSVSLFAGAPADLPRRIAHRLGRLLRREICDVPVQTALYERRPMLCPSWEPDTSSPTKICGYPFLSRGS